MDAAKTGVVGAGLMGAEIALVQAMSGREVLLVDAAQDRLDAAMERLAGLYDRGAGRGFWKAEDKEATFGRLETTVEMERFADRDFVTEAVFESEEVKAGVFAELDRICGRDCVFASNTSTIPITVLASYVAEPRRARFVGMHYFSPVTRMRLVEVIPGAETSPETVALATRLALDTGKTPIRIKDVPGFAVNRLLHVLMIEAVRLVEEDVASPEDIDMACKLGLGHPMGPFELMDATTSSLCLQAQQIMFDAYGERFRPRPLLKARVRAGYVGGRGRPGWRK